MANIRLLTLDLSGTLIRFSRPVDITYRVIAESRGLHLHPDKIWDSFLFAYKDNKGLRSFNSRQWWINVARSTLKGSKISPLSSDVEEEVAYDIYAYFSDSSAYELYPDAEPFLKTVHSYRSFPIGALTNSDSRIKLILDGLNVKKYFDFVLTSEEMGMAKPDVRVFSEAMKKAGISEPLCVHIGDDFEKDYLAARKDPRWTSYLLSRQSLSSSQNEKGVYNDLSLMLPSLRPKT